MLGPKQAVILSSEIPQINELRRRLGLPDYGEDKKTLRPKRFKTLSDADQYERYRRKQNG